MSRKHARNDEERYVNVGMRVKSLEIRKTKIKKTKINSNCT